jgi:hypothetical protein
MLAAVTTITPAPTVEAAPGEVMPSLAALARSAARLRDLLDASVPSARPPAAASRAPLEGLLAAFDLGTVAFEEGLDAAAARFATACRRVSGSLYAYAVVAGGVAYAGRLLRRVESVRPEPGAASRFFERAAAELAPLLSQHETVLAQLSELAPSAAVERACEGARAQWWRLRAMQSGLAFLAAAHEAAVLEAGADTLVRAWESRHVADAVVTAPN